MLNLDQIELMFKKSGGVLTTKDFRENGISHYYIKKMLKKGLIESLHRGIYKKVNSDLNEMIFVSRKVKYGIFCMFSSATIHELTTFIPQRYHVAIPKKNKVRLFNHPPVKLYYWDVKLYSLGIKEISIEGHPIYIYDLEKTVCDFFKFRNKIGFDTAKEVLKTYLDRNDRDINKLVRYSKELRIHSLLDQNLRILL